jgi:HEAT repeat protein
MTVSSPPSCVGCLCLALAATVATGPLGRAEDRGLAEQVKVLRDRTQPPARRAHVATDLGSLGPKARSAVPALIDALEDTPEVAEAAQDALVRLGEVALPQVAAAVSSPKPEVQTQAIVVLQGLGPKARDAAPALLKPLASSKVEVRLLAARALGIIGAETKVAIPGLFQALSAEKEGRVRFALVEALDAIQDPTAIAVLAGRLGGDPDFGVRCAAADALGRFGSTAKAAIPVLIAVVKEMKALQKQKGARKIPDSAPPPLAPRLWFPDPVERLELAAGHALCNIGEAAVPAIIPLLKEKDKDLRSTGLLILADIGTRAKGAVLAIVERLDDAEAEVREDATTALGSLGRAAVPSLPALRQRFQDSSPRVRVSAGSAALSIDRQCEGAVEVILDGLRHRDAAVRLQAAQALRYLALSQRQVVAALATAAGDSDELVQIEALTCLARRGGPADIVAPALEAVLKCGSDAARVSAVQALGQLKEGKRAVPVLIRALQDADADVRRSAAESLGVQAKYAAEAIPALTKAVKDPDAKVRQEAAETLARIEHSQKE